MVEILMLQSKSNIDTLKRLQQSTLIYDYYYKIIWCLFNIWRCQNKDIKFRRNPKTIDLA